MHTRREILDYLQTQRICVLAVEMPDGSPHAATVHFAHTEEPFMFFFETDKRYRKSEALFCRDKSRASLAVGFSETEKKTAQLDGEVRLLREDEKDLFQQIYAGKFPEKSAKLEGENVVRFVFTPTWWRFSDFANPGGKLILTSTDAE